ncbi:MAG: radical SAM protein [Bryobacteraceae bacterium]|nr:radical SAM protein [Bryobacteraceae bacterium]
MSSGASSPFDFISRQHFQTTADLPTARALFRESVIMVEIEVFSYCNRRCWFCPNSRIDRISKNDYMDPHLYERIMRDLASVNYSKTISYSRYNEPLSDRVILQRLAEARGALPNALLHTNTNGDYLTAAYLRELYHAGLNSLNIQVYLGNDERYDHGKVKQRMSLMVAKLGLPFEMTGDIDNSWVEAQLFYEDMKIRIYGRNFSENGANRGGLVQVRSCESRTSPCLSPFFHLCIDFNGNVVPCCNIRSDAMEHAPYVVATLSRHVNVFQAYADSALVSWRRGLIGFGPKSGVCASCLFGIHEPTQENLQKNRSLTKLIQD